MKIVEALKILYPQHIPQADYEKVVRLVLSQGGPNSAPPPQLHLSTVKRSSGPSGPRIGKERIEVLRQALSTGPATALELAEATGINQVAVYEGLRKLGARVTQRLPSTDGTHGKGPAVYVLPPKPTA